MLVYTSTHTPITLDKAFARGGEATIYQVDRFPELLAKVYKSHRPEYEKKLDWMIAHTPQAPNAASGLSSFGWPHDLLYDETGACIGYLMPYIQNAVLLLEVFNPRHRANKLPTFNWLYLHRTACNLATALQAIHDYGYVVGDLNESNILVTPAATVTIIDTDSFQVHANDTLYPCPVGKAEYMPPEAHQKRLRGKDRQQEYDLFGLGVLIFQTLMDGSHPFRGRWKGAGDPPALEQKIAKGWFPYAPLEGVPLSAPPSASLDYLHPKVTELVQRCFVQGHTAPNQRPTAKEWADTLQEAEHSLVRCAEDHYFYSHLDTCPQCALTQAREEREALRAEQQALQNDYDMVLGSGQPAPVPTVMLTSPRLSSKAAIMTALPIVVAMAIIMGILFSMGPDSEAIEAYTRSGSMIGEQVGTSRTSAFTSSLPLSSTTTLDNNNARRGSRLSTSSRRNTYDNLIRDIAWSPDGTLLAVAETNGVALYAPETMLEVRAVDVEVMGLSVAFSPDGLTLATAGSDAAVKLWRVDDGTLLHTMRGHSDFVNGLAFTTDGSMLASAAGLMDKTIKLWRVSDGGLIRTLQGIHANVNSVAFAPDGKTLASADFSKQVKLWNVGDGDMRYRMEGHTSEVFSVAFAPNGQTIASGSLDGTVKLWNATDGTLQQTLQGHTSYVRCITFAPDGLTLASGSDDKTVRLWSTQTGMLLHTLEGHTAAVLSVAFAPDGARLVSGGKDGMVKVWDME